MARKREAAIPFSVVHVNTGIGVERTREFVREMASYYDLPFLEYKTPEDYDKIVSEHGTYAPPVMLVSQRPDERHMIQPMKQESKQLDKLLKIDYYLFMR